MASKLKCCNVIRSGRRYSTALYIIIIIIIIITTTCNGCIC
jgi:hypothetical protein